MTEEVKRKLNATESINNYLPAITEAFVAFYGESEREKITNKFKNVHIVAYNTPDNINYLINESNKNKSNELIKEFLNKLTQNEEEQEKLNEVLFQKYSLEYESLQPINMYVKYKNGENTSEYNKKNVVNFLKKMYPETTEDNLDTLINKGTFKNIDIFIPYYNDLLLKYKKYKEEIRPYKDYVDKCSSLKSSLNKKYYQKLAIELKDLFTEEEYKQIEEIFNKSYFSSIVNANAKTKNYTSYSLTLPPLISAFNEENEELLQNGSTWKKDNIKKDRIEYFKNFGIDLGEDYDLYINDERVKKLIPSKELITRIESTMSRLNQEMINEYYSSLPEFKQNREKIDALGLLDKEDGYTPSLYEGTSTAIWTNIRKENNQYIENPILFLYMGTTDNYLDHFLIHELNHVYELSLPTIEGDTYKGTCGWDLVDGKIDNQESATNSNNKEREKREYELFNEIINELIAQEISEILTQSGVYIFNTKENKKIKGGSSYEATSILIRNFYETYKTEIIESRKEGNLEVLFNAVGKENFEELNKLFHRFNESFGGMKIYTVYSHLKEGKDTEETREYNAIVAKSQEIFIEMQQHSKKTR